MSGSEASPRSGDAPPKPFTRSTSARGAAVFFVALLLLLPGLGTREFSSRAEARIPMVALDILRTGRILPPYLLGEPYLNKPPLHHLMAAGAISIFGSHAEWVARVPSVLCGAAAVWLTWLLASRLGGRRDGIVAAAFLFLSAKFYLMARSTELEILLTAASCIAYLGLAQALWMPGSGRAGWWIAATGLAIASLAKGPAIALIFPFALIIADAIVRRTKAHLLSLGPLILILGALAGTAVFYLPLVVKYGGIGALRHRLTFENVLHEHAFHYYFWQLPLGLLPAGFALPWMITSLSRKAPVPRALALAVAIGVLVFSMSSSKQSHYLLPLYPLVALWAAASGVFARWSPRALAFTIAGLAALLVGLELSGAVFRTDPVPSGPMRMFAEIARGRPLALMERHPVLGYYLDRPDLEIPEDAAAAARLIEDRDFAVVVDLERGETLAPALERFRPPPGPELQPFENHTYLLLRRKDR